MKYTTISPGSCGEFVQGIQKEEEVLVSYKIDMYTKITLEEKTKIITGPPKARKALQSLFQEFALDPKDAQQISINIQSEIPMGKGMSSSTADILGVIKTGLKLINKTLSSEEMAILCCQIEPTDSIVINSPVIFNPLNGKIIKKLENKIEGKVLILEPPNTISTLEQRYKKDYIKNRKSKEEEIQIALELLEEGYKKQDLKLIGQSAIISARANENIHKKPYLEEIINISKNLGSSGVNIAHSGTVIGILLEKDFKEEKIIKKLEEKSIHKYYTKIYIKNII